ncbi:hypothetical protein ABI59_15505 [Acidobacteria bacterium Mor1]|nr:hypothetical protein ABI59_15505 [Acidobacteria bacterium Mor1]
MQKRSLCGLGVVSACLLGLLVIAGEVEHPQAAVSDEIQCSICVPQCTDCAPEVGLVLFGTPLVCRYDSCSGGYCVYRCFPVAE